MSLASELTGEINNLPEDVSADEVLTCGTIIEQQQISSGRWTETVRTVYQLSDGSFLAVEEDSGLTEMQDCVYPCATGEEVFPVQSTVIRYLPKD